jgi:ribonucleoside-triphosphate reductase
MVKTVTKRDGKIEIFNFDKVAKATSRAFESCGQIPPEKFVEQMNAEFDKLNEEERENLTVEEIQDIVEKFLMKKNKYEVAKAFILYRDKRTRARDMKSKLVKGVREKLEARNIQNQNANVDEMSFGGRMGEATSVITKEIALETIVSEQTRNNHINNEIYIHDLDHLATGDHNCLTLPLDYLLANGFSVRQTDVRPANSVNTAFQLVAVLFQIQSLQQFGGVSGGHIDWTMVPYVKKSFRKHMRDYYECVEDLSKDDAEERIKSIEAKYGEISFSNEVMKEHCEHVFKYGMKQTEKEVYQAVEGMYHNLNTLMSRSGCQLPFTSINYGTCTEPEGRMVIKALLDVSIAGLGKFGRTSIFPCGIFQCMKGVNRKPGDPNYDLFLLALKSTSQRIYPNYCNCDSTLNNLSADRKVKRDVIESLSDRDKAKLIEVIENNPDTAKKLNLGIDEDRSIIVTDDWSPSEIYATMGCRTINGFDINFKETYERYIKSLIKGEDVFIDLTSALQKDGRGNICPTTIILPTLAMEAKENYIAEHGGDAVVSIDDHKRYFFDLFNKKMEEAKDSLIERFNWICKQPSAAARFMYDNHTMAGYVPEEGIKSALKHGTLTIGILGVEEACQIIFGTNHYEGVGMEFTDELINMYSQRLKEYKETYKLNFATYYTPAENLCHTAMKKFKSKYGVIPNISDREYFTNSIHVPVWAEMDPFQKIDIESKWANKGAGGTITYVEFPSTAKHNVEALETLVNYAMDKDIPYFAINLPLDCCEDCGFQDEMGETCPKCGSDNITRLRRVTGYLTGDYKTAFNKGKVQETEQRVKHIKH